MIGKAPRPGGNINAKTRKVFEGQWRGRKRPKAPALDEMKQAGSYTFSASALARAVHDCGPMELRGAGSNGWALNTGGWTLRGWNVIRPK